MKPARNWKKSSKLDEKYYKIAVNDGEISKEFMEYYDQGDWKLY